MAKGYVSIHREIFDHWVWKEKPFSRGQAWIDLIMMANHCDAKIMFDGRFTDVKRGDILTSSVKLAERWGWSRSKVSLFLENLETDHMIVRKTDSKKTALTICNYFDWQDSKTAKEQVKDSGKTAERQQKDTINNVNNSNNEEIIKDIRSALPSDMSKDKATALKRIPIILKEYSADNIKKSIRLYIADVEKQRKTGFKDLKYLNEGTFWNSRYMTYIDEEETQKKPPQKVDFIRIEVTE